MMQSICSGGEDVPGELTGDGRVRVCVETELEPDSTAMSTAVISHTTTTWKQKSYSL